MNRLFSLLACSLSAALATSASATVVMDYVRVGNLITFQKLFAALTHARLIKNTVTGNQAIAVTIIFCTLCTQNVSGGVVGTVEAWGYAAHGQLNVPSGLTNVRSIAGGALFSLALKNDGTIIGWGSNIHGQLNVPSVLNNVISIAAGDQNSLALKNDGTVTAWGYAGAGGLNVPADLAGVTAIACGSYHLMALKNDGTVVAWGNNDSGQATVPTGLNNVVAIDAAGNWSIALKADGSLVTWGSNDGGQRNLPPGLIDVKAISIGAGYGLALKMNGTVVAWGSNDAGQCNVPPGLSNVVSISAASLFGLALKSDGTLVDWGSNSYGPMMPAGLSGVGQIDCGGVHALALYKPLLKPDTDSDGIDDLAETNTGIYISPTNTGTNPNSADTDVDGVPDGLEVKEKTSPVDATKFNAFSKGLVSYYPFNGNSIDESGSSNNGTNNGAILTKDRFDNSNAAYQFNGSSYILGANVIPHYSKDITLSCWVKSDHIGLIQGALCKPRPYGDYGGVAIGINGDDGLGYAGFNTDPYWGGLQGGVIANTGIYSTTTISDNKWHHLSTTINGSNIGFYLDGRFVGSSDYVSDDIVSDNAIQIGREGTGGPQYGPKWFYGAIDDVRVYTKALSNAEVLALYQSEAPPKPQFQIIQGSYTWQQAKADAEARGGRLAVLNTQAKIDEADTLLATSGYPLVWIGLTDEIQEGVFKWVNGDPLTISRWGPGQPDNASNEDYVHYYYGTFWNDLREIEGHGIAGYLLEFPKQILITTTTPTHGSITGAGEYDPGTTATLTATPDAGYAFTGWTGDASGTTNPLSLTMDASKTVSATFAADLSDADADGLTAYDEVTLYHTDPTKADSDNDGLSDAYELGIGRFSVISGSRTWAQAKAHAETQGGTLATFANQVEWNLAMQSIGTDALLDVGGLWIGATDEVVEGTWAWVTGEPFVFTLWETGQPDNSNNSDYAAVAGDLGGTSGKWYDYRATTSRDGYILESGYSTNPSDADSDDDSLLDGAERTAGSNPFNADTDGDGLTDAQEVNLTHTNPTLADSNSNGTNDALDDQDSDGLTNLAECNQYGTDPAKADTDGDGLTDLAELGRNRFVLVLPTSPLTFAQALAGARGQGGYLATFASQAEYEEALAQIPPDTLLNVAGLWIGASDEQTEGQWRWLTGEQFTFTKWALGEPNNTGNSDYAAIAGDLGGELGNWYDYRGIVTRDGYILEKSFITDPLLADTDGDEISDSQEIGLRTSPNVADTDGDGSSDGSEIEFGGDPIIPSVSPQWKANLQNQNSSSGFELRFPTRAGEVYQIEACSDLIDWSVLETGIQGTGSTLSRTYASEGRAKRFFRVQRN